MKIVIKVGTSTLTHSTGKGYTVNVYNEELIGDMQDNLIYVYGGDGKILNALSATKEGQKVVVIEFENKSDLDIMYRELQKGLAETDKMDLSSNILAYGTPEAVKTALK